MSKRDMMEVGRLALRSEGEWLNAYHAPTDTMEGATLVGCVRLAAIRDERAKRVFIEAMRAAIGSVIKAATGVRPVWGASHAAPEHERAGRA